jgi:glycosyltransferase involved in cell wall biosynthesis
MNSKSAGPLVSVIIPVFNRSDILPRAINSVLQQSYKHIEILVIDDHSTENLSELCKTLPIQYLKSQGNGVSAARNTGIKLSRGDYIAFLDSDDEWQPQKVQLQVEFLINYPTLSIVHSNELWRCNDKTVTQLAKHKKYGGRIFEKCLELCIIGASCTMTRRHLFDRYGYFDETFPTCEDYDLWLRISAQEDIGFLEDALTIKHAGHSDQLSLKYHSMDMWRLRALAKHIKSSALTEQEYSLLLGTINKKSQYVLKGARKHLNLGVETEVLNILSKI